MAVTTPSPPQPSPPPPGTGEPSRSWYRSGYPRSLSIGAVFSVAWSPCIGPILGGILTLAAAQETVGQGMFLLFVYSMGLGIPFILAGVGMTKLLGSLKFIRKHLKKINVASGLLMVVFGWLFISGRISDLSSIISDFLIWIGLENLTAI